MSEARTAGARWRRTLALCGMAVLGVLTLVAGCGGGTSQYDPFVPERLFAFGDEMSALTKSAPLGRNYAVNGLSDNGTPADASDDVFSCNVLHNWVQSMAAYYGFVFAECNPDNLSEIKAQNYADAGARVADVETQVESADILAGGIRDKDIATVLVGVNDIIELYRQYDLGTPAADLEAEAGARGVRAARIVNGLVARGAKVIVSNIPDMGLSPFAAAEKAAHSDIDRAALLSALSAAFNQALGVNLIFDGRYVGIVQLDLRSQQIARSPASFGIADMTQAICTTAPPDCTTATLIDGADAALYLWASDRWFSYAGQLQLATLALARAQRNPF